MRIEKNSQRSDSKSRSLSTLSSGRASRAPDPRSRSHGFALAASAGEAGRSRATTSPRRAISTTFPSRSTARMISRQRALNSVTEIVICEVYMTSSHFAEAAVSVAGFFESIKVGSRSPADRILSRESNIGQTLLSVSAASGNDLTRKVHSSGRWRHERRCANLDMRHQRNSRRNENNVIT